MKRFFLLLTLAGALGLTNCPVLAQEVVTTGTVSEVGRDGTLMVRSDQTQQPVTFYGLAATNIFTVDGNLGTMEDLKMGTKVTVQYAERAGKWYVSKIMLPAATAPKTAGPAPMPAATPMVKVSTGTGNTASPNGKTGTAPVSGPRAP